jgi:putative membrane protein
LQAPPLEVVMNMLDDLKAMAAVVLLALPAHSQTQPQMREERVLSLIHEANQSEIQQSSLATDRSDSAAVKDFAARMVTDHTAADHQVSDYANSHGIDLDKLRAQLRQQSDDRLEFERRSKTVGSATGEWAFSWENTLERQDATPREVAKLRKLRGAEFDREYVRSMVDGHQEVVDRLTDVLTRELSPDLRTLVQGLLPALQQHLDMAKSLQDAIAKA